MGSNRGMDTHGEKRLTELEIKASFLDDMVEELNKVLVRQQSQIDLLLREVAELRSRSAESAALQGLSGDVAARARDNLPPHY